MPRPNWFVAFPVAAEFVEQLTLPPPGIRRFHPADVHLTIVFLGRCSEAAAQRGLVALDQLPLSERFEPLTISLGRVVAMGPGRAYSALSALVAQGSAQATSSLERMRAPIALASLGRTPRRPAKPHVTVARPRRNASPDQRQAGLDWASSLDLTNVTCTLDRVALYSWSHDRRERLFRIVAERSLTRAR